jgi:hypothetical protein
MISLKEIGAPFLAVAAPFMLTANAGALPDECKKAPAPLDSNRATLIDLSSTRTPVLIAQAQPDCPPRDAITVLQERNQRVIDGQRRSAERFKSRPPVPGS